MPNLYLERLQERREELRATAAEILEHAASENREITDVEREAVEEHYREIATIDEIEVGRHGLIVEKGYRRGLLLPQVPVEHRWTVITFLEHTCLKAGLPRDAWKQGARVKVFEAEVFGEHEDRQV